MIAPIDRDGAREAAREELSKGIYHTDDPNLFERALSAFFRWLDSVLSGLAERAPGGPYGLVLIAVVIAALFAFAVWRGGPLRRGTRKRSAAVVDAELSADAHRRQAEEHARAGRYAEAVRERMRAIVAELETRGVLDPRPGRTADEVAREAGDLVPAIGDRLAEAARVFDRIWYGRRPATAADDATLREIDGFVRSNALVVTA